MIDEPKQEAASLYVLGALPDDEAAAFATELRADPELKTFVNELQESTAALALLAPLREPPAFLGDKILAQISADAAGEKPRAAAAPWLPWALAACLVVLCVWLAKDRTELKEQVAQLEQQNAVSQMTIATLSSALPNDPKPLGVVVWDKEKQQGELTIEKLPPQKPDRDYQIWIVDPKFPQPVSAGVFDVDENGATKISFKPDAPINSANKFAISLERKGGVPKAEGPIVLISK